MSKKQFSWTCSDWYVIWWLITWKFKILSSYHVFLYLLCYTWNDIENVLENCKNVLEKVLEKCFIFYPSALRAGGVLSSRSGRPGGRAGGRAGGCQTCGTHISVTAGWIFSVRSSMELSRPVVVHCHAHLPICPIWACPWAKNLSNLPQIGSRLCGSHISETAGWIYPI